MVLEDEFGMAIVGTLRSRFQIPLPPPQVVRIPDVEAEKIATPRQAAKMIMKAQSKNYA